MSTEQASAADPDKSEVRVAFLLGWAVSQTLGNLRKGARPSPGASARPADYAPRLVVSDGVAEKSTDAFVLATQRVVQFYRALEFEDADSASPLTAAINRLPQELEAWLSGQSIKFHDPHELREMLNSWSLQVWARLGGASVDGLRAFTAGMSLADTYWYMRLPTRRPKGSKPSELSEENWRRLLSKYRLDIERSRLRSLEKRLPPYVAAVISAQLKAWRVGTELGYRDGKLVRIKNGKETASLRPRDEATLQEALARQMQNWEAMVFGTREATTFLQTRDRRMIVIGHRLGLVLTLVLFSLSLAVALAAVGYVFVALLTAVLPSLLRILPNQQVSVSDLVSVGSLLWTVIVGLNLPLVLRVVYQPARAAQKWIDDRLTIYYVTRRTYVPWDKYLKEKAKG